EENIGRTLIELARQLSVRNIELEEKMTRWQSHFWNLTYVPRADYQPARVGISFDLFNYLADLIYRMSIRTLPRSPLCAIYRPEFSILASPFIPDVHTMFLEIPDVRLASQEPEK